MGDLSIMSQFFTQTLPQKTKDLVAKFQQDKPAFLNQFYLSGGTGLSLQLGHRESEDLDFFSQDKFNSQLLQKEMAKYGKLQDTELAEGTVNTFLQGVKVQLLEYPYDLLKPTVKWKNIKLSSVEDIACTKLQTIGMRGSKKDFVDLYFLLKDYTLDELLAMMPQKYEQVDYNQVHILKSLVYFTDAEQQPMPRLYKKVTWKQVKQEMIKVVKETRFK